MVTEAIRFRLIICPECHHNLCWVNPRLPSFCPECGRPIYAKLRTDGSHILISDDGASIRYSS